LLLKYIVLIAVLLTAFGCTSKTKEELYGEGVKLVQKADPNGAIVFFKNALEKDQNYFEARYQLARAYMAVGKFDQAEKEFLKVSRQNPSRADVMLEMAKLYSLTKRPDLAIKAADEYLHVKAGSPDALEVLGIAYALKNKLPEAQNYLLQTLRADPARISAKLELANLYKIQGKDDEFRRLLDEVRKANPNDFRADYLLAGYEISRGKRDKALVIYQRIADARKLDSFPLYKIGGIYLDMGEIAKADLLADDLLKNFPNRPEGSRLKGLVYYFKKNYPQAITELQHSLKMQSNIEAQYFYGLSLYNQGELENALSEFRKILDENGSFQRARLLTAMILLRQHRIDDSIAESNKLLEVSPDNALAHNVLGSAYMAKGMYGEGIKELNKAIAIDPRIIEAHLKKGAFHLSTGNMKEAETDLNTAVNVAPEILNTRLILASYYMRRNNYVKTLATLSQGLSGKKSDAPLYNYMAAVMFTQNKQADGLRYLLKAKETDADSFDAYFNIAMYYAAAGDYEKALQEYREVLRRESQNVKALLSMAALLELKGRDSEAYDYYNKAVATKNGVAFLALASYHMKKKESGKALAVINSAIKAIPRNVEALEVKGRILLEEKDYKEALKVFGDIEAINPEQGITLKINAYLKMKDFPRAQEQARRVIALIPNSAVGYIMLSSVYENENDLAHAVAEIKNGIRVDSGNLQAILLLGNLYVKIKDYKSAMDCYTQAYAKNMGFVPALFAQGMLLEETGKKKEAILKYQAVLMKSENYVPALNNLAYLYVNGYGSPKEGLRLAFNGFKQDPSNPSVMDTLGYALLKNGRYADAQKLLEKVVVLLPGNATIAYHLALVYKELGMRDQAVKTLQKSLTRGEFPEAALAGKLLVELQR
jgi:putative PEP-CTERM system TPR-repeat lipoprotein